jgi:hypothetical protein
VPAPECRLSLTLTPGIGYVVTGGCGERVAFGVGEVLRPEAVPANACRDFRDHVLHVFGKPWRPSAGGTSSLGEPVFVPYELGKHPRAQADEE